MKFSKTRQLFLVSTVGLLGAVLFSGCQLVTVDYVFLASSAGTTTCSGGEIETYAVDSQSGVVRQAQKPVCSGGVTPVALAVSPDEANLYVANRGDKTVVHFAVSTSGVLTSQDTVTLPSAPVSLAVSPSGKQLFALSGTTSATLTAYALSSGKIGSVTSQAALTLPAFSEDTIVPTGVTVLANGGAVYATVYDASAYNPGGITTSNANPGWLFGFSLDSGGGMTSVSGSPYNAGVKPSALVAEPTSRFVYVTDFASSQLIGYGVYSGFSLNFLQNGPFRTGNEPTSIAVDPRGKFLYTANALDSTVSAFIIDLPTGTPSSSVNPTGSASNITDTQPDSVFVEPALGRYVYTANFLGNSISGFRLDPTAGSLKPTQNTPYPSGAKNPTAIVLIPHGNHSTQTVTP
jgi:6-phosphogluconolactonase (cycloisomerase 2 family)